MMLKDLITRLQYELEKDGDRVVVIEIPIRGNFYRDIEVASVRDGKGLVERVDFSTDVMDYVRIDI